MISIKKIAVSIAIIGTLLPTANAWNANSSTDQILREFSDYEQPEASGNTLVQGNMRVQYVRNEKRLTDKIVIRIGNRTRTVKGPWSQATASMRTRAFKSMKGGDGYHSAGFYDYSVLRISPSGNYIELVGTGYENWIWRMVDTKTGEIVFSDHTVKSMWSNDRKQFVFETCVPSGITSPSDCTSDLSTHITTLDRFPEFTEIR